MIIEFLPDLKKAAQNANELFPTIKLEYCSIFEKVLIVSSLSSPRLWLGLIDSVVSFLFWGYIFIARENIFCFLTQFSSSVKTSNFIFLDLFSIKLILSS